MTETALAAESIDKTFGATRALAGVNLALARGEIHALVGENGAGKSTLIRILSGVMRPDGGALRVAGAPAQFGGPRAAMTAGIVTIPQELRLVPALSVEENIVLGHWPRRAGLFVDRRAIRRDAERALATIGVTLPLGQSVRGLGFAERQLIVIAKALRLSPKVLILDEPTAALEHREVERLIAVVETLKADGVAILYVSHRLQEIVQIADRCTILRDGQVVDTALRGSFDVPHLVEKMTGRRIGATSPVGQSLGPTLLRDGEVAVCGGEVVGVAGLLGSGARDVVRRLFGLGGGAPTAQVGPAGRPLRSPREAMRAGIGFVPGERAQGLVMGQSVRDNIALPNLSRLGRPWWIGARSGDALARRLIDLLDIRPNDPGLPVAALSGGNQQKVIFAKWLAREVEVMLLDEPTHGIDILAKARLHALIRDFVADGHGVLMHSTDIDELLGLCDAVLAVKASRLGARLERGSLDEHRLQEAIG